MDVTFDKTAQTFSIIVNHAEMHIIERGLWHDDYEYDNGDDNSKQWHAIDKSLRANPYVAPPKPLVEPQNVGAQVEIDNPWSNGERTIVTRMADNVIGDAAANHGQCWVQLADDASQEYYVWTWRLILGKNPVIIDTDDNEQF